MVGCVPKTKNQFVFILNLLRNYFLFLYIIIKAIKFILKKRAKDEIPGILILLYNIFEWELENKEKS